MRDTVIAKDINVDNLRERRKIESFPDRFASRKTPRGCAKWYLIGDYYHLITQRRAVVIKANNRVDTRSEIREVNLARELNSAAVIRDLGSIWTDQSIAMRINIRTSCETRPRLAILHSSHPLDPNSREESFIQRSFYIQPVCGVSRSLFFFPSFPLFTLR